MNDAELAAYLDRRISGPEREQLESHLAACPECRQDLLETRQLLRRNRRPRALAIGGILAAAAALILVIRPAVERQSRDAAPIVRASPEAEAIITYGPIGQVSSAPLRFAWAPEPGARSYRLTLTTSDGATLWSASGADTVVTLPRTVRLKAGERYLWVVDALLDDGRTRSTGLREFSLGP